MESEERLPPKAQKLTISRVQEIKLAIKDGWNDADISKEFGISERMVRYIRKGRYWSHVTV